MKRPKNIRSPILGACVALVGVLASNQAMAQDEPVAADAEATKGSIGVDAALVVPFGKWSDTAGVGLGGFAYGDYAIFGDLALTGHFGYIHHLPKTLGTLTTTMREIPLLVGAKYRFGGPYLGTELGVVIVGVKNETDPIETATGPIGGGSASNWTAKFAWAMGPGYEIANFDIRAQFYMPVGDGGTLTGVLATVGYRFFHF